MRLNTVSVFDPKKTGVESPATVTSPTAFRSPGLGGSPKRRTASKDKSPGRDNRNRCYMNSKIDRILQMNLIGAPDKLYAIDPMTR